MAYGSKTIGSSAIIIVEANPRRRVLLLTNNSDDTVIYIGPDSSVTSSTGTPLFENQTRGDTKDFGSWSGPVYGITAGNSADVRYWEVEGF